MAEETVRDKINRLWDMSDADAAKLADALEQDYQAAVTERNAKLRAYNSAATPEAKQQAKADLDAFDAAQRSKFWGDAEPNWSKMQQRQPAKNVKQEDKKESTVDKAVNYASGIMPSLLNGLNNIFGNKSIDPTGASTHLREQADLHTKQAGAERKNEQQERQIANRDYRVEAEKNAASEAAFKNAQTIQNMGAATGNAAAALNRTVGNPDYNTHMSRQDQARQRAVQNQREAYGADQTAIRERQAADNTDYVARDALHQNNLSDALSMGLIESMNGSNNSSASTESEPKVTAPVDEANKYPKNGNEQPAQETPQPAQAAQPQTTAPAPAQAQAPSQAGYGTQLPAGESNEQTGQRINETYHTLQRGDNGVDTVAPTGQGDETVGMYGTKKEREDLFNREEASHGQYMSTNNEGTSPQTMLQYNNRGYNDDKRAQLEQQRTQQAEGRLVTNEYGRKQIVREEDIPMFKGREDVFYYTAKGSNKVIDTPVRRTNAGVELHRPDEYMSDDTQRNIANALSGLRN